MAAAENEFTAIIEQLFALKPQGTKFGIDRMRVLAAALGHPERLVPCIHIAGTNGKGSVAAMLDAILRAAGWRTGLYTSPHLVHVGERVQVNRRGLSDAEIVGFVEELRPISERIAAEFPEHRPSFFELMTAMAFLHFGRQQCDLALVEVGLGGRLDATNVVTPQVSVITSIGLDHCEYLGNELTQIAAEKAGIVKPNVPLVIGRMPRDAEKVIRAVAAQVGAPVTSVAERYGEASDELPSTNLEGEYQRWNAATATLAALALKPRWRISPAVIAQGLVKVAWAGRWQRVRVNGKELVLDASHNPEGAQVLDANLTQLVAEKRRPPIIVTGVLGRDRARPLIETICRHASEVHFVVPKQPRACGYEELEALVPTTFTGRIVRDTVETIFPNPATCSIGGPEDVVIVTGSMYLVGEVIERLGTLA
jgi:dihydrofolate synthase / folylpolyglutamate synthase